MKNDPQQLAAAVERAREGLLRAVVDLNETQGAYKPATEDWAIVEILEHLYLAELGGITKIWTALNAVRDGRQWAGDLPNRGKSIEDVVAATWKPKEVAPAAATPHFGGPLAAWVLALRSLTPLLRALTAELDGQPLEAIVYPHVLSGPLDARQRLEFLRFHIERHTAQAWRVRSSPGFPP